MQKWCVAYGPNDLIMVYANNETTEPSHEDLICDKLVEYKNCTLSDLLGVVTDRFIPKLYENYIELNVRYTPCYKGYHQSMLFTWIIDQNESLMILLKNELKFKEK